MSLDHPSLRNLGFHPVMDSCGQCVHVTHIYNMKSLQSSPILQHIQRQRLPVTKIVIPFAANYTYLIDLCYISILLLCSQIYHSAFANSEVN